MPRLITVALALSLLLNGFFIAGFVYRGWVAPLPFEQRLPLPPPPPPPPGAGRALSRRWLALSTSIPGSVRRCKACSSSIA